MAAQPTGSDLVDEHLSRVPEPQRTTLTALRTTLRELLPEAEECISYRMPCFKVGGKAVAGYDAFRHHCSYFPHSGNVLAHVDGLPAGSVTTPGTLRFPVDRPLSKAIVRQLVAVRLAEIEEREAAKRAR